MRFYDRKNELKELQTLLNQADTEARLLVLTGRRRIGKTLLAREFAKTYRHFYLFVEKKPESLLAQEYLAFLKDRLPFPVVGQITRMKDILILLFEWAKQEKIILILDEFQEFYTINPSIYSEIQNLWDTYKSTAKILFIAIGSVHSLMHRIFEDAKEPLFGRADRILKLDAFSIPTLWEILQDHQLADKRVLFDFFVITGGVPKYLDFLLSNRVSNFSMILNFILSEFSPLLEEGKHLLILEFGKEYSTYFSILELLACGKTSRSEIESVLGFGVGGYIERLEKTYDILQRIAPIHAKPTSHRIKFRIKDPFLQFWFRFIYRNASAIELKNFEYVKQLIKRDYQTYTGRLLEHFFYELLASTKKYNRIGSYWEPKNLNEIDIVAIDDLHKELLIAEVKLDPKKFHLETLQAKAQNLLQDYPHYKISWKCLSLDDACEFLS